MKRCAIIGGGISGLSAAYFLKKKNPAVQITLYETSDRLGGVIRTEHIDGCIVEAGPDSFLTQKEAAAQLCRELGLTSELIGSNDERRKTFICCENELKTLPDGFFLMVPTKLSSLIQSDLLSWPGKLAALGDLFLFPETKDISVSNFVEKRFGVEILNRIAEPLLAGIYGADVRRLSLKSALPQIWELQKSGSLIRGLLSMRPAGHASANASLFTTLRNGMESLPKALVSALPDMEWRLNSPVSYIERKEGGWRIDDSAYESVIVAAGTLPDSNSMAVTEIKKQMETIRRNSAVVVVLALGTVKREGFGWLVPEEERHSVLACTYSSNKFPGRSPEDRLLLRLFIGGRHANEWMTRADCEIVQECMAELNRIAHIDQKPFFSRVYRWKNAMPEYAVGHETTLSRIEELRCIEKEFYLTGSVFAGVGIPDCIRHAERIASDCADALAK